MHPQEVLTTLSDYPHSVARRAGETLTARTSGLYRASYRAGQADIPASSLSLIAALPGGGHNSRTVRVGPDGRVYVSLGISGNCSDQYLGADYPFAEWRGGVLVLRETGSKAALESFACGLRNPVGVAIGPDGALYLSSDSGINALFRLALNPESASH